MCRLLAKIFLLSMILLCCIACGKDTTQACICDENLLRALQDQVLSTMHYTQLPCGFIAVGSEKKFKDFVELEMAIKQFFKATSWEVDTQETLRYDADGPFATQFAAIKGSCKAIVTINLSYNGEELDPEAVDEDSTILQRALYNVKVEISKL